MITVKNFIKKYRTSGQTIHHIYRRYLEINPDTSLPEFEFEYLKQRPRAADQLLDQIQEYIKDNGEDCYEKFIKEFQYISEKLWRRTLNILKYGKKKKSAGLPEKNSSPMISSDLIEGYNNLLPVNWVDMGFAERMDFVQKIQHKGFFDYVLTLDPKLKKYCERTLTKSQAAPIKVYVSLFSIPTDNYSEESKNLLKCFVEHLNQIGRAKLQCIEYQNPNTLEVREMRR